jgi:protein involved in polysaccharide export with SLBB domain
VQAASYQQAELIKVDVSSGIEGEAGNILLQPFDVIIVRSRGNYEGQRTVLLAGQVYSPGSYVLQSSKERISGLMMRAGGFKSSADSSSISIRRVAATGLTAEERQRAVEKLLSIDKDTLLANPTLRETYLRSVDFLSVNVEKIKENPGGPEDVILEDGDYIEVARSSSLVRVSGEVYHTNLLPYKEGASARYYIKQSGNYTHNARRKKTFVVYPDGRAKAVKSFLFFKTYPTVTARSEVFVPSKKQDEKKGLSTTEWIALSSIIATLATLAITVLNATK